jgi:light-harvesting protein B-800-850 alpha chain
MNQSRMWLVVRPGVGIPLLLGGVVIMSLIVHFAILTNTTWFPAFFGG